MSEHITDEFHRLIDKDAIRETLYSYCHALDRRDIALLRSITLPDARFEYGVFSGTASEFADFVELRLIDAGPTHHNLTNTIIRVKEHTAESESYCIAVHGDVRLGSELTDLVVYLRYIDNFVRHEGSWKIAQRLVVYDWNQNLPKTARWDGPRHQGYSPRGSIREEDPSHGRFFL